MNCKWNSQNLHKIIVIHCTWAKDICTREQWARAKVRPEPAVAFNSACETAATKPPRPWGGFGVLDFCKRCLLSGRIFTTVLWTGPYMECSWLSQEWLRSPSPRCLPLRAQWVGKSAPSAWTAVVYAVKNTIWKELNPPEQSWLRSFKRQLHRELFLLKGPSRIVYYQVAKQPLSGTSGVFGASQAQTSRGWSSRAVQGPSNAELKMVS